jgi:hypothetical protein
MQPHPHQTREQAQWCSWCKVRADIDVSHRQHPLVAWGTLAMNADGAFSCKPSLPCAKRHEKPSGAWRRQLGCRAFCAPKARTTVRSAQAGRARNCCLETPGTSHPDALRRQACGVQVECMRQTLVRMGSLLQKRVRRRGRTFWCERESHGASRCAKARAALSFRRPGCGRARPAVRSRFLLGMLTLGIRPNSSFPVGM